MSEGTAPAGFGQRLLLTVIAEGVIEERLLADLRRWGVGGLTTSRVEGDPFGSRVADVAGAFVRMECVVPEEVSTRVLEGLAEAYFGRYKVIAYDHPVRVVRGDKYT
jgi:nitrogen regulatory protein P-II 2